MRVFHYRLFLHVCHLTVFWSFLYSHRVSSPLPPTEKLCSPVISVPSLSFVSLPLLLNSTISSSLLWSHFYFHDLYTQAHMQWGRQRERRKLYIWEKTLYLSFWHWLILLNVMIASCTHFSTNVLNDLKFLHGFIKLHCVYVYIFSLSLHLLVNTLACSISLVVRISMDKHISLVRWLRVYWVFIRRSKIAWSCSHYF